MKSLLDYIHEHGIDETVTLTAHNLDATKEEFHNAVRPYVDAGGGPGFVVTMARAESFSGHRRPDGGLGRYIWVSCGRVA